MHTTSRQYRQDLPPSVVRAIDDAWKLVGTWLGEDSLRAPAVLLMDSQADTIRVVRDGTVTMADFERRVLELARTVSFDQAVLVGRSAVGDSGDVVSAQPVAGGHTEQVAVVAFANASGRRELQMARLQLIDGVASLGHITSMPMPVCLVDQLLAQRVTVH